ncbi:aldo/keto reductase [Erwinia tasmaniensis]|uniref:aldo/keto reductase n=1 Tax=Erwinia tasmaniensis TaxID=338565 RepID=UPI003A4D92DF
MKYAQLGTTGVFVSRLCLGTMTFGGAENAVTTAMGRLTQKETEVIVGSALDAGINFIDTADVYGGGASEEQLGQALKLRRHEVVLATKMHARVGPGPNQVGQSRIHLMNALENSLRRLKTDHIDLYQLHNFDPYTPLEEVLRTLDDAVSQGKVRYIGCSNFAGWQLMKAAGIAELRGYTHFASVQSWYSLAGRDIERELIPAVADSNVGLLCWSPLAGGLLSGKFDRSGTSDPGARRAQIQFPPVDEDKALVIIDQLKIIAERHQVSVAQIALAWVLAQPAVTSVITGVKRPDQLADNLGALDVTLSDDDLALLDEASRPPVSYPGWIQSYNGKGRVPTGYTYDGASWQLGEPPC